jgi:hypothetical protein
MTMKIKRKVNLPNIKARMAEPQDLSQQELERLDQLLTSARNFHYSSFILAGLSLAIVSLDRPEAIVLPIAGIALPGIQASVAIYFVALIMAMCTEILFSMAYPWLKVDRRRPPFPWIALGAGLSNRRVTTWILMPPLLCGLFSSFYLQGDYVGLGLIYGSLGVVLLPRTFRNYRALLLARADHRGGDATFSIYLLYWHRLFRQSLVTIGLLVAVFAAIPKWRSGLLHVLAVMAALFLIDYLVRVIGGFPPIYRRIDKFGERFGFPAQSRHYR